jgi:DNA-binding NtrC family response regulator
MQVDSTSVPETGLPAFRPMRVLVVDDQESVRGVLRAVLRRGGFEVETAADGQKASLAFGERRFDLLVTDVDMPGLSGIELMERVRAAHPAFPVVMISGGAPPPPAEPPFVFLAKPFEMHAFLETCRDLVPAPPVAPALRG